ncbi:hypothetical protein KKB28_08530 [bacterium]|nr:hypothetical protein [bacterium]
MRRDIVFLMVLVLVAAGAAFAATLPTHQVGPVRTAKEPATPVQTTPIPAYNDGSYDIFPVQMQDDMGDGGRHLDYLDSTVTLDDFEGGHPAWSSEDLDAGWFWRRDDTLDTDTSWWCADPCLAVPGTRGAYNDHWLQYLVSDTFDLTGTTVPTLKFKARWRMETPGGEPAGYDMWDTWNVWGSTNAGATWSVLGSVTPRYTGTSSYAFGEEWGMGTGIPGFGDTLHSGAFVEISYNLAVSVMAGKDSCMLRWAFCSDPAFSGADNPDYYGLIIDSIRVTTAQGTVLSNDGEQDEFTFDRGPVTTDVWVYDNTTSHSPTHSWVAQPAFNNFRGLYSYPITLPTGYESLTIQYWVWCDMPDSDGDNDNSLEDYYQVMISDANCLAWSQVVYDYGYDNFEDPPGGNSLTGWVLRIGGLTSGGTGQDTIGISAYAGQTIRIAFRNTTDGDDNGGVGTGLHIDDVRVIASRRYDDDLATRDLIVPFPTTVGLATSFNYTVFNEGINSQDPVNTDYWVLRPDATTDISGSVNFAGPFATGDDSTITIAWTPDACGSHLLGVRCNLAGDDDTSNDTTETPINSPLDPNENLAVSVQPEGLYELAYHTRALQNAYTNPRYIRYTPVADGVPSPDVDNYDMLQLRVMWQFDEALADTGATAWIEFWEDSTTTHPSDSLIYRLVTKIDTLETIGRDAEPHWWVYDLSAIPELQNRSGDFWVSVSGKDSVGDTSGTSGLPSVLGRSETVAPLYDLHHFVIRQDSLNVFMQSPGRYLVQVTIGEAKPVDDLTVYRDGTSSNVTLRWSAMGACATYKVYRLTTPYQDYTTGTLLTPTPISGTSYTDTGIVTASSKNFYVVIAVY